MSASGVKQGSWVLKSEFDPVKSSVTVLKNDIIRIDSEISAISNINDYNAVVADITSLQQSASTIRTDFDNLESYAGPVISAFPTVQTKVNQHDSNFVTVAGTLLGLDTRITTAQTGVNTHTTTLSNHATNISNLLTRADEIDTTLESHAASLSSHASSLSSLSTAIGLLDATDDALITSINSKQNTLVAGDGITISGDVISAIDSTTNGDINVNSVVTENNVTVGRLLMFEPVSEFGVDKAIWYDPVKGFVMGTKGQPTFRINTVRRGNISFTLQRTSGAGVSPATFGLTDVQNLGDYGTYDMVSNPVQVENEFGNLRTVAMCFELQGLPSVSPTFGYDINKVKTRFRISQIINMEPHSFDLARCSFITRNEYNGVGRISFYIYFYEYQHPGYFETYFDFDYNKVRFELTYEDYNF